ncbi:AEC family transporter [Aerococcaceae bacterium 50-4]
MTSVIQMIILVMIMLIGYVAERQQLFSAHIQSDMAQMITVVTAPALILSTINASGDLGTKGDTINFLIIAFVTWIIFITVSFFIPKLLKAPKSMTGTVQFLTVFQNNGFMGLPLILALYGPGAMFYASLVNIPTNLFIYTFGVWSMSRGNDTDLDAKQLAKKLFLSPGFLAGLAALIFFLLGWQLPAILEETMSMVGAATTPLAMMVIGMAIAHSNIRNAFSDIRVYLLMGIKMIILPIIIFLLFRNFITNELILSTLIVTISTPGPAVATSYALLYNGDVTFSTNYVFLSTLVSVATIPLLINVLGLA